ncbi:hypothetical protein BIW11_02623 [Tropilaelaps mercedesae]|uniref:Uncharacterized protein n=1 Tax=Tropilaelaps mercedesae TaxID=418985 RepID=A0A1V9Y017_9ACAR|nr:hypothetical protein BIW11_02623 [Tropilaelaps mercedesae]
MYTTIMGLGASKRRKQSSEKNYKGMFSSYYRA